MKAGDRSDLISLLKLAEHIERTLGPRLAAHAIREKWATGEVRFWVDWVSKDPKGIDKRASELAPFDFVEDLEKKRGRPFAGIIRDSERGIYFEFQRYAFLFASRADAAKFWPWDGLQPSKRITARKMVPGAPTIYDWEKALIEAACHIYKNGLPKRQSTLVNHILDWFGEDGPGETQVKAHIGPLYKALSAIPTKSVKTTRAK